MHGNSCHRVGATRQTQAGNRTRVKARYTGALACGLSVLAVNAALAQDEAFTLDPIRIYGDRTATTVEETNSSLGIVGEDELDSPTVSTYRDAFKHMANVQSGDFTESGFVIRGINSEGQTPGGIGAPLASFYIDGVQQTVEGIRRGIGGVFDAEQVEVYRGPQSTLSGRAALAGAVYLRTKDPVFEEEGQVQLTYGENNHRQVGVMLNTPLSDNIAFRFSAEYSDKDNDLNYPSYTRFNRYNSFVGDEYYNARAKILWLPTGSDTTRVLFTYARSYENPASNDIAGPNWSTGAPSYDEERGDIWGDILPDYYRTLGLTELPAFQDVRTTRVDNFAIEVTHEINTNLTLTAITGWSHSVTQRHSINEGTPGEFLVTDGEFDQELFSHEFRLNYDAGALRWVAGLYGAKERQRSFRTQQLLSFDQSRNSADITNLAAFGEVSYEFVPNWRVIAGGRVDYIDQTQTAFYSVNGVTTANTTSTYSDTVFIPKVGLQYDFGATQRVALTYQEGYRPGGAGIKASDGTQFTYEPEKAKTLELAWRGRFMGDRLSAAANLFYMDWDNQQIEIWENPLDSSTSYIANAGKSESYGAELQLFYAMNDRLDVYAAVGLLKTEFEDFNVAGTDWSGLSFPGAPERSIAVGFEWGDPTGWFGNGNVKYVSSSLSRLEQGLARPATLDSYTVVDAAVGYAWDSARVTLYATNLLNEDYFTYEYGPGGLATLGDRREVGLRFDYTF